MKNLFFILLLAAGVMTAQAHNGHGDEHKTHTIDNSNSTVTWLGKKVTGKHTGQIDIKKGMVTFHGDKLVEATMIMDMTSITCTDIEDEGTNAKLIGHLKSDDFFGVETHPEASFSATGFEMSDEGSYNVTGNLTIKGTSHEISFPIEVQQGATGNIEISGTMTFDRTKYNVKYGSGKFFDSLGDKMINDDVSLTFNLATNS